MYKVVQPISTFIYQQTMLTSMFINAHWMHLTNYKPQENVESHRIPFMGYQKKNLFDHLVYSLYSFGLKFAAPSVNHMCKKEYCQKNIN
jgi:hypothetical protein